MNRSLRELNSHLLVVLSVLSLLIVVQGLRSAKATVTGNCPLTQGGNSCHQDPCTAMTSVVIGNICGNSGTQGCCYYERRRITCWAEVNGSMEACGLKLYDVLVGVYLDQECSRTFCIPKPAKDPIDP